METRYEDDQRPAGVVESAYCPLTMKMPIMTTSSPNASLSPQVGHATTLKKVMAQDPPIKVLLAGKVVDMDSWATGHRVTESLSHDWLRATIDRVLTVERDERKKTLKKIWRETQVLERLAHAVMTEAAVDVEPPARRRL